MSEASDGPGTGPVEGQTRRSGRPPVPPAAPPEDAAPARDGTGNDGTEHDGQHRTERVTFPVPGPGGRAAAPPATVEQPAARPPETGRLHLGGYPPRVPGAARREAAPPHDGARDDD
ncbi:MULTISPECIES: hypothetical protein [unclassified Modestobacter]|uniref:hypothetical protein n=1 Tax=unclassified Modestobacter TaxID=2643866 RepID=UPI0022AA0D2F|nr:MULTISPECIES: hypothetical protein [unclassified Modestobacter]MCZ2812852.1 hypothetical protein [Modestobacter sp. VKM Ac-2979]MCZ2843119.1 hypothetical protein [Modestobacter sp. VKM Ac-2980]MCZ2847726.1 hypothetical protein [Modestobacter sp. VKM Ac-2978]